MGAAPVGVLFVVVLEADVHLDAQVVEDLRIVAEIVKLVEQHQELVLSVVLRKRGHAGEVEHEDVAVLAKAVAEAGASIQKPRGMPRFSRGTCAFQDRLRSWSEVCRPVCRRRSPCSAAQGTRAASWQTGCRDFLSGQNIDRIWMQMVLAGLTPKVG